MEGNKRYAMKNNIENNISDTFKNMERNANSSEIELFPKSQEVDLVEEPMPREESWTRQYFTVDKDNSYGNALDDDGLPPNKSDERLNDDSSGQDLSKDEPTSPSNENDFDIEDYEKLTMENSYEEERSELRQRKLEERKERRERLASQVREMKRRQVRTERWHGWKRSLWSPMKIGVGVGILLIGFGAFAYLYYSKKL